ncbi:MAG: Late embryosis abundant protein [Rhodospirillales bacterium]|nr:Late embryosis abundant protein [Rhodospirillales bacterium]
MENSSIKEQARHLAEQQKDTGAEQLGAVAGAIHGAAKELEEAMPEAADFIHDAAARVEDAAEKLRKHNLEDLASGFASFARSQPAAFFSGAVLAGFAVSRFLKSSTDRPGGPRA